MRIVSREGYCDRLGLSGQWARRDQVRFKKNQNIFLYKTDGLEEKQF